MQPSNDAIQAMSYEQAYAELEEIVSALEMNSKTLDEAIALFERGQSLSQHCASLLEKAELRVRQLSEREALEASPEEEPSSGESGLFNF
jgi:exodeoxyribonuclease VII small subunit